MPRFAANLTLLFTEMPFLDRFQAAADAGFEAVEFLFPYGETPEAVSSAKRASGVEVALFNMPAGDFDHGERGLAGIPGQHARVIESIETALRYADALDCPRLHMMAGLGNAQDEHVLAAYRESLTTGAERLRAEGRDLLIEPLNPRSTPGYVLQDFGLAESLIAELGLPNLRLQFDIFHRQILHGDVSHALRRLMPIIGHIQIAAVPHRHEPGTGELDDGRLLRLLDDLGYAGFVGCEYNPADKTSDGLGWYEAYRN